MFTFNEQYSLFEEIIDSEGLCNCNVWGSGFRHAVKHEERSDQNKRGMKLSPRKFVEDFVEVFGICIKK